METDQQTVHGQSVKVRLDKKCEDQELDKDVVYLFIGPCIIALVDE